MHKKGWLGMTVFLCGLLAGTEPCLAYEQWIDITDRSFHYTLTDQDPARVVIDCDSLISSLLRNQNVPGNERHIGMILRNSSQDTYQITEVQFVTDNVIDRSTEQKTDNEPFGSIFDGTSCMYPDLEGFDGHAIPYRLNVLRCISRPLQALYQPYPETTEVTLAQLIGADEEVKKLGYHSYSEYLLDWYRNECPECADAETLYDLEPVHIAEIFGTKGFGYDGQTEVRQPRKLAWKEAEQNEIYNNYLKYGSAQHQDENYLYQSYEYLETDPELIRLGYWWLYAYGITFSFNVDKMDLDEAKTSEIFTDGLSAMDFMMHTGKAAAQIDRLCQVVLQPGEECVLSNIGLSVQLPNAYDERWIDMGLMIVMEKEGTAATPEDPGDSEDQRNPEQPERGENEEAEQPDETAEEMQESKQQTESLKEESTAEEKLTEGQGNIPDMGDSRNILIFVVLDIFALAVLGIYLLRNRKK